MTQAIEIDLVIGLILAAIAWLGVFWGKRLGIGSETGKFRRRDLVASIFVLAYAVFVFSFSGIVIGIFFAFVGLPGAFLAKEIQIGHTARPFSPTPIIRFVVAILIMCVSLGSIYSGLGSPPALRSMNTAATVVLEFLFLYLAGAVVYQCIRALLGSERLSAKKKFKEAAFSLLFATLFAIAAIDVVRRLR